MADLTMNPSAVLVVPDSHPQYAHGVAAVNVVAGQLVYLDPTSGGLLLAQANAEQTAQVRGLACHGAFAGQPVKLLTGGILVAGGALIVPGVLYYVSAVTPGGIAPEGDLLSAQYTTLLGIGVDSTRIQLRMWATGLARG